VLKGGKEAASEGATWPCMEGRLFLAGGRGRVDFLTGLQYSCSSLEFAFLYFWNTPPFLSPGKPFRILLSLYKLVFSCYFLVLMRCNESLHLIPHLLNLMNLADNPFDDLLPLKIFARVKISLSGVLAAAGAKPIYRGGRPQHVGWLELSDFIF